MDGHKLMFPGDSTGLVRLVWNRRCTMRAAEKEGVEAGPRQMRDRTPVTRSNETVSEITYQEWKNQKTALTGYDKKTTPKSSEKQGDISIGRSLGAKVKNYDIKLPNKEMIHLTDGTRVTGVQTIAGKGKDRKIDEVDKISGICRKRVKGEA